MLLTFSQNQFFILLNFITASVLFKLINFYSCLLFPFVFLWFCSVLHLSSWIRCLVGISSFLIPTFKTMYFLTWHHVICIWQLWYYNDNFMIHGSNYFLILLGVYFDPGVGGSASPPQILPKWRWCNFLVNSLGWLVLLSLLPPPSPYLHFSSLPFSEGLLFVGFGSVWQLTCKFLALYTSTLFPALSGL